MSSAVKQNKTYLISANGVKVEMYDAYELYLKLSSMDEVTRLSTVKLFNKIYGYEAFNYKTLHSLYKNKVIDNSVVDEANYKSPAQDEFERDYIKSYMKLLSC